MGAFVHQAGIYSSDEEFLAMAVPFVTEGLDQGQPVLVATTSANLDVLSSALGDRAGDVDYAESAYFGRRTSRRIAAFHRYWRRHATAAKDGVRVLAEPVWTGRSASEIAAWRRLEAGLNLLLSDTPMWMICPYDTRIVDATAIAEARRTHPAEIVGRAIRPSADYIDPEAYARGVDTPLPQAPPDAATLSYDGDFHRLRRFVTDQAVARGLSTERAGLLALAAGEAATYLAECGGLTGTLRIWSTYRAVACELHAQAARAADPFVGFWPPGAGPEGTDGMWVANQLCDHIDVRFGDGCTIRLQVPGPRAEELAQTSEPYTR